jgi:hypothetical protein
VVFSRQLLAETGVTPRRAIAVQKPYMERRTLATFAARWPELGSWSRRRSSTSTRTRRAAPRDDVVQIMVGDLQRLIVYGEKGWSSRREIPREVKPPTTARRGGVHESGAAGGLSSRL